ncbi:hypothetical protein MGAST_24750 [Mycobacterium gastri 'Wayne']|uniref:PknH-like extracellular domain-containing protein n=1 Tax=Mycobacterium gastri TaxID=1777 RepID=A0A1X1VST3_MYCGS|nr:hypothetical protein MGAST_24750 [Mycobacterium gastri 'Wayne']ORV72140.1 hypothetical protein AWC07_04045 [Mycobacterium gastri]
MISARARLARVIAVLSVGLIAAGCTAVVAGTARPTTGSKPRPIAGQKIKQVLLDEAALSRILDQPFKTEAQFPPLFGGRDELSYAYGPASPADCVGVVTVLARDAYRSAAVNDVAREIWWHASDSVRVISVAEGVVTLPTAADADALFAKFSQQWNQCDGTVVYLAGTTLSFADTISDVRVANSVLAATVSDQPSMPGSNPMPVARAIGLRVNCLVDVEVTFFGSESPSGRGTANVDTSAIDIAHAMMDTISQLS